MPRVPCARRSNHNIMRPAAVDRIKWHFVKTRRAFSPLLAQCFRPKTVGVPRQNEMGLRYNASVRVRMCVLSIRFGIDWSPRGNRCYLNAHGIIFTINRQNETKKNHEYTCTHENHTHTHSETHAGGGGDEVSFYVCPFRYNFICNLMKTVVFQNDNLYEWSITPGPGVGTTAAAGGNGVFRQ